MILSSLISRSSSSLLQRLSKVKPDPNAVIMFSVSANALNLEAIISRLRLLGGHSIGCLSSPLPGDLEAVICSTATFPSQDCVLFRSEIRGRAPIQVGRWNRKTAVEELPDFNASNWGDVKKSGHVSQLPAELFGQRDITSLLFFSDEAPEGLMHSMSQIPQAEKLGLVASSTPFITGRPFTLFHDEQIYSSGAVGLGLKHPLQPRSTTAFHGLVPLSTPMEVSKSEGNLIHELDQLNPSKLLIETISNSRMVQRKDEDFFLGHLYTDSSAKPEVKRVYRILSGDPSRGTIALEADSAPDEGEIVQFFSQASFSHSTALEFVKSHVSDKPSIHFLCSSDGGMPPLQRHASEEEAVHVLRDTFLVASENGFLCTEGMSSRPIWKCALPGAVGSLTWADHNVA